MIAKEKLNELLINRTFLDNIDILLTEIPEINNMIGFEHKHPHHHLDVWKHTLLAMNYYQGNDLEILMALLLHDIGKPFSYQDEEVRHFRGHPLVSRNISEEILHRLEYNSEFIDHVLYLITTHDTMINIDKLDNNPTMILKRLEVQYCDAYAHHPDKVQKRITKLNEIENNLMKEFGITRRLIK